MTNRPLTSRLAALAIAAFGLSQVAAAGAALVRLPMSIKYLGTQEFGLLITITAILPWLSLLLGGSRITTRNNLSAVHSTQVFGVWRFQLRRACGMSLQLLLPLAAVGALGVLIVDKLPSPTFLPGIKFTAIILVLYASCTPIFGTLAGGADALGKHNLYAGCSTGTALLSIPATWLGIELSLPLEWFVLVAASTFWLPSILVWLYFLPRLVRNTNSPSKKISFSMTITAASQGLGILFSSGLDVIIVAGTLGLRVAGSYGISTRLLGTIMIPAAALAPAQFKHFAELRSVGAPIVKLKREIRRVLIRNSFLTLSIAIFVSAIYGYVFRLMTEGVYETNYLLGCSLALATVLAAIFATFFAASAGELGLKVGRNFSIAIGALNLLSTIFLTKILGVYGPSIASIFCFGFGCILWIRQIKRTPEFLVVP